MGVYCREDFALVRLPGKVPLDCYFAILRHLIPLVAILPRAALY